VLYREPKLLKEDILAADCGQELCVSVLYREPKLLKASIRESRNFATYHVSVLYREPKLLKATVDHRAPNPAFGFSALP